MIISSNKPSERRSPGDELDINPQLCHAAAKAVSASPSTRLKNRLKRWEAAVDARLRERITRSGLVFVAALTLVGLAAFASANNLLFLLLAAMVAVLMVSGFVSRLGLSGLELDVQLPEHISARQPTTARIRLHNEKSWAPSFAIQVVGIENSVFSTALYFPVVPGKATLEDVVEVRFARRGVHKEDSFQFSSRFPFGFAERRERVTLKRDVLVYPCLDPQSGFEALLTAITGDVESHVRGSGNDFYRIRPYEHLESARHVDWKATAHTGSLQVREFARDQDPLVHIFLDLDVPPELSGWFEYSIECCAFLAMRLVNRGARLRFQTQGFDRFIPVECDVYTILKYLALVESSRTGVPSLDEEEDCVRVALSANPRRFVEAGWNTARVVGPDDLPRAEPGTSQE